MTHLTGSLHSIPLLPLARFISSLGESGQLRLTCGPWLGTLVFEGGQPVSASAEGERGLAALELMLLAFGGGEFAFDAGAPGAEGNLEGADVWAQFERLASGPAIELPAGGLCAAVYAGPTVAGSGEPQLLLTRQALGVLLDVDGQRSVAALAERRGALRTLKALARLHALGLVAFGAAPSAEPRANDYPAEGAEQVEYAVDGPDVEDPVEIELPLEIEPIPVATAVVRERRRVPGRSRLSFVLREATHVVLIVGLLTLGFHSTAQTFRVQGSSMEPTLAEGQLLLANRAAYSRLSGLALANSSDSGGEADYLFGPPQRGDIVIFHAPPQPGIDYIKRIIAVPGDLVLISAGQVFVNGELLAEPYVRSPATYTYPSDGTPLAIPADSYFVLGDNRRDSVDSHLGWLVPANNLVGKTWLTNWPLADWGFLPAS